MDHRPDSGITRHADDAEKCEKFRLDPDHPIAQGLRPLREGDARVEREPRMKGTAASRIVHSYGHGIGGWTLAFGSALEVAFLVDQVIASKDLC